MKVENEINVICGLRLRLCVIVVLCLVMLVRFFLFGYLCIKVFVIKMMWFLFNIVEILIVFDFGVVLKIWLISLRICVDLCVVLVISLLLCLCVSISVLNIC